MKKKREATLVFYYSNGLGIIQNRLSENITRRETKRREVKRSEANEERTCTATDAERPSSAPCGEKIAPLPEATVRDKAHVRGLKKIAEGRGAGGTCVHDQRSRVGLGAAKERLPL